MPWLRIATSTLGTFPTIEELVAWAETGAANGGKLPIIAIDNVPGCKQLENVKLPAECLFLFGQEGPGLSQLALDAADMVLGNYPVWFDEVDKRFSSSVDNYAHLGDAARFWVDLKKGR